MAETTDKLAVSCSTCPCYVPLGEKEGACHHGRPQVFIIPMGVNALNQPNFQFRSVWAPVSATEWCSDHPLFGVSTAVPLDHRLAGAAEGTG